MTLDILSIFAAILLHELAHVLTAVVLGVKVKRFGLCWRGVYIVRESGTDWQNLLISLAGPFANLAFAALALLVFRRGAIFCAMNLLFGVINLLPLPYSDGLRAYKLLWRIASSRLSAGPEPAASAVAEHRTDDLLEGNSEQQGRQ
jgi:Zn-dependent protease